MPFRFFDQLNWGGKLSAVHLHSLCDPHISAVVAVANSHSHVASVAELLASLGDDGGFLSWCDASGLFCLGREHNCGLGAAFVLNREATSWTGKGLLWKGGTRFWR